MSVITFLSFRSTRFFNSVAMFDRKMPPKYTGNIHGIFVGCAVTQRKGFFSVLAFSKKKINIGPLIHLDPQQAGFLLNRN